MKIERLNPGQTVYSVVTRKMGNTSINTVAVFPVKIVSIDEDRQTVDAIVNNNTVRTCHRNIWSKWRLTKPELVDGPFGSKRLARRGE